MKKPLKIKGVMTVVDDDHPTYETWGTALDGKMFESLGVPYTGKK